MSDCPEPDWYPQPPMALAEDWELYREKAITWMVKQPGEFTADTLRGVMPDYRPEWMPAVFNTASRRGLIEPVDRAPVRSTHPSRRGSLLTYWRSATPNH